MILLLLGYLAQPAAANSLPQGQKAIILVANDGTRQLLGSVELIPDADGAKINVVLDAPEFKDEFLSMRPFRCLPDVKEMWCHLAYPYAVKGRITPDDLADLEYALLFLFKPQQGYGIDAWNGLYFKLTLAEDGNLSGTLHETDLNALAVPPDASVLRPIPYSALTPVTAGAHRFTKIEFR
ncbi:MAG: hypothetical protein ABL894_04185 [Hyphomicrobium sp.]